MKKKLITNIRNKGMYCYHSRSTLPEVFKIVCLVDCNIAVIKNEYGNHQLHSFSTYFITHSKNMLEKTKNHEVYGTFI